MWDEWYRHTGQQSGRGGKFGLKINIVNEKIDFPYSTNFKLLSRV
jgi:hypothetical protein